MMRRPPARIQYPGVKSQIHIWLEPFGLEDWLRAHVVEVVAVLPTDVRQDLMDDPSFVLHDYEPRFSLSMWELLFLSFFLFAGATSDLLTEHRSTLLPPSGPGKESPPGSHCRPEP